MYKTNKYRLPLLKIISVTSAKKTFSMRFAFLESEKEVNVTWALEMFKTLLKDQENMLNVIIIDRHTALMNSVAKVFPTSYALLCQYHITKKVRSRLKPVVGNKQIKDEDKKMVKPDVVLETIMDAWKGILKLSTKDLYVAFIMDFRSVSAKQPDFLKYIESTILDQVKEKIFCSLTDRVRHLYNTTTNIVESAHSALKNWLGDSKGDFL